MFCAECGQRLAEGTRFCPHCGTPVATTQPSAAEPPRSTPHPAPGPPVAPIPSASKSRPVPDTGTRPGSGFDTSQAGEIATGILARVKNIVLSPATEWPVIAAEASSARTIYLNYVAPLVAISVVAGFLGQTFIGMSLPLLGTVRMGIVAGLAQAIVTFALSFVGVFVIALIVDALAPTFGGQKDSLAALKATAYSFTPAWVASVLNLIPVLAILVVLAALYGLYLLYLGLPVLMRTSKDKAVGYTVVTVLCAIATWILIGSLSALVVEAVR